MIDKHKSTFLNNCYEWLFSEEERRPLGFIIVFILTIIIALVISLFVVAGDRHGHGWGNYLWS